jgi:lysozyme
MKLNESGHRLLELREGLRLRPYLDTQGVPTIAMGNTFYLDGKKVTMLDKSLTLNEAKTLSRRVADIFANKVDYLVTSNINQNQFNALVSLAYNIGIYGFRNSTVLKLVNKDPNNTMIRQAFMMWTKNKELIGRRQSEVNQYFLL